MKPVDLHFHLLPGVDDGPADIGDSIALARQAVNDGIGAVVATPHVRHDAVTDPLSLPERIRELRAALLVERIDLEVHCGGELGHELAGRLSQRELDTIAQGPRGARWLLVETPFVLIDEDFHAATRELRERGFGIVLAHPERSADVILDGATGTDRELAEGAIAQVTAGSLLGEHGAEAERAAWQLVAGELALLIASDAHGPTRPPCLTRTAKAVSERLGDELRARNLTVGLPRRLLARGLGRHQAIAA